MACEACKIHLCHVCACIHICRIAVDTAGVRYAKPAVAVQGGPKRCAKNGDK